MGVREHLNKTPLLLGGVGVVILVGALVAIWRQLQGPSLSAGATYYTADEGATYFEDNPKLLVPIERDGKEVVRAHLFRCGDGKPFVGFMQRFPPDMKAVLQKVNARKPSDPPPSPQELGVLMQPPEIRRTGTKEWKRGTEVAGVMDVLSNKCPDGKDPVRITD